LHTDLRGGAFNLLELVSREFNLSLALLAAPRVKAVRAQTMFNDSYVYVVFEDGTDIYWARSRVLEYLQQIEGRLPENVHPMIGPDATGAGWVYEYALVDHSHKYSLADLRALQGSFGMISKPFLVWQRLRALAGSFASIKYSLILISFSPTGFPYRQ